MNRLVLFFRDQARSAERHKEFGRRFGKLHVHPAAPGMTAEHPEIFVIEADETSERVAGEDWHADVSCDADAPMGSILHLSTVPPDGGGDTKFANMYLAYETLSAPIKKMLEGMTAIHDGEHVYRGRYAADDAGKTYPRSEHPVVSHIRSRREKCLFANRVFTTRIVGLQRHESTAIF